MHIGRESMAFLCLFATICFLFPGARRATAATTTNIHSIEDLMHNGRPTPTTPSSAPAILGTNNSSFSSLNYSQINGAPTRHQVRLEPETPSYLGSSHGAVNVRHSGRPHSLQEKLLLPQSRLSTHASSPRAQKEASDPFRQWLRSIIVRVPDLSRVDKGFNITTSDVICQYFDYSLINSSYTSSPLLLTISVRGISLVCHGSWDVRELTFPHIHKFGAVLAELGNGTGMDMTLMLYEDKSTGLATAANLSDFSLQLNISNLTFSGDFSKILNVLEQHFILQIEAGLESTIGDAVSNATDFGLTRILKSVSDLIVPFLKPVVPDPMPTPSRGTMNLDDNALITLLDRLLDEDFGAKGLNYLIRVITNGTGIAKLPNITTNFTLLSSPAIGTVVLGISDVVLSGLDTWSTLDILRPGSPISNYSLSSIATLERLCINVSFFISIDFRGGQIVSGSSTLFNRALLSTTIGQNKIDVDMVLALKEALMRSLSGLQMLEMACLSEAIEIFNITSFRLNTTLWEMQFRPLPNGPNVDEDLDLAIENVIALFTHSLGALIPNILNGVIGGPLRQYINTQLTKYIFEHGTGEGKECIAPDLGLKTESITFVAPFMSAFILFLVIAFVVTQLGNGNGSAALIGVGVNHADRNVACINRQSHDSGEETPLLQPDTERTGKFSADMGLGSRKISSVVSSPLPRPSPSAQCRAGSMLNSEPSSLVLHPLLSPLFRFGVLFLLCVNLAMFVAANCNVGASVYIVLSIGGHVTRLPDIFQFTLANSVRDMWQAGVYPLSIIIALFSGCWPYIKLLLVLFCWISPPYIVSEKRRESILRVMDALGKWSLIDSFVMILMLVAFRFHLPTPKDPSTSLDVYVRADIATIIFSSATMLSLVISHFSLYMHRLVMNEHKVLELQLEETEALRSHCFRLNNRLVRFTLLGQSFLPILILLASISLVAGAIIPSFSFLFKGFAALALQLLNLSTSADYSLVNVGALMPNSSDSPDSFSIRFLQLAYYIFVLVVPLANLLSLLVLWITPLTLRAQHRLFVVAEILNAWSALDVFVFAIIASLLQLRQFAKFIVGDRCDVINAFLRNNLDHELHGDDVCFDVISTLASGCWVLFCAAVLSTACSVVVMQTCHSTLLERTRSLTRKYTAAYLNTDVFENEKSDDAVIGKWGWDWSPGKNAGKINGACQSNFSQGTMERRYCQQKICSFFRHIDLIMYVDDE